MLPIEEWFQQTEARRLLVVNLKSALTIMLKDSEDAKSLLRVNLIFIRQAMLDEGVE